MLLLCYLRTLLISSIVISLGSARHIKRGVKALKVRDRSVLYKQYQQKQQDIQYLLNSGLSRDDAERIINSYNYQNDDYDNTIPNDVIKPMESFMLTRGPDVSVSSTSEYYPSTPPWYSIHEFYNNEAVVHNKKGDSLDSDSEGFETHMPTSTTTDLTQCPCDNKYNMDQLLTILTASAVSYEDKRNKLIQMGLFSEEHARVCYKFCMKQSPSMSFSYSTRNIQTYPPESRNSIEIVTESVDPEEENFYRYHCYEMMAPKSETMPCLYDYTPKADSPKSSVNPEGKNVWTCCKKIPTYRAYYNY